MYVCMYVCMYGPGQTVEIQIRHISCCRERFIARTHLCVICDILEKTYTYIYIYIYMRILLRLSMVKTRSQSRKKGLCACIPQDFCHRLSIRIACRQAKTLC